MIFDTPTRLAASLRRCEQDRQVNKAVNESVVPLHHIRQPVRQPACPDRAGPAFVGAPAREIEDANYYAKSLAVSQQRQQQQQSRHRRHRIDTPADCYFIGDDDAADDDADDVVSGCAGYVGDYDGTQTWSPLERNMSAARFVGPFGGMSRRRLFLSATCNQKSPLPDAPSSPRVDAGSKREDE